jgi:hypothetical protein
VIRNAVIHLANEQPLVADLPALPGPGDTGLLCTNLRTLDGRRPVFIDRSESVFFIPYVHIRFVEMPDVVLDGAAGPADPVRQDLRRSSVAPLDARETLLPVPVGGPEVDDLAETDDVELEIDEDFLRRIREA